MKKTFTAFVVGSMFGGGTGAWLIPASAAVDDGTYGVDLQKSATDLSPTRCDEYRTMAETDAADVIGADGKILKIVVEEHEVRGGAIVCEIKVAGTWAGTATEADARRKATGRDLRFIGVVGEE